MSGIRPIIDAAVADVLAQHPKYFTDKGHEHARTVIVRKVMAAIRGDGADKSSDAESSEGPKVSGAPQPITVAPDSTEARAFANLRRLAGAQPQFRSAAGVFINAEANNASVFAFADLPPDADWLFLTERKNVGAWMEFFGATLPGVGRRPIAEKRGDVTGIVVPWPWPPSVTGKIYTESEAE